MLTEPYKREREGERDKQYPFPGEYTYMRGFVCEGQGGESAMYFHLCA